MNLQDVTEKLRDFFLTNIVDPLSARGSAWIYDDEGRILLDKSPFPKVLIKASDGPTRKQINAIGSFQTMNTDLVEVHIKCKMGSHYGVGDYKYTGKEFCAHIAYQFETILKDTDKQKELDVLGFHQVLVVGENFSYDQEKNPTFVLRIEVQYLDP